MTSIDADLRQAVDERLAARLEAARARRAAREQARREKTARRAAGLNARHARKLARHAEQPQDDEPQDDENVQRPEMASSTAGGRQPQDDEDGPEDERARNVRSRMHTRARAGNQEKETAPCS